MERQRTVRILILAVVVVAVLAVLAYVLANRGPATAVQVRIAHLRVNAVLPYLVAADKGFFEKRGLKVELIAVESASQAIEAVIAGRAEVGVGVSVQTCLAAWATSAGLFHVLGLIEARPQDANDCMLVKKDSPITKFSDLSGKKIGGIPSTFIPLILQILCEKNGLPSNCVQYVSVASSLQLEALQAGSIDVAYTFAVTCDAGVNSGVARVLMQNPQQAVMSPMPSLFAIVSASFEKAQPRAVNAVQDAALEGLEYIKKNTDDSKAIRNKYVPGSPETPLGAATAYLPAKDIRITDLQTFADLLLQRGLLTKKVEAKEMLAK